MRKVATILNTVFYCWQSDRPNGNNRTLIEEAIKTAIESCSDLGLNLQLDKDTTNEPGTPDIANTILRKIDTAYLFICDVTIINDMPDDPNRDDETRLPRKVPNPNVILELGYAARAIGWERIICAYNTEFGTVEDLPFDLRFRRPLQYGFSGKSKSDVRKQLATAIENTIRWIKEKEDTGDLVASRNAVSLRVGLFDYDKRHVLPVFRPLTAYDFGGYKKVWKIFQNDAAKLITDIQNIHLERTIEPANESEDDPFNPRSIMSVIHSIFDPYTVVLKPEETGKISDWICKNLDTVLDDAFFSLGNLKGQTQHDMSIVYSGTDDELKKHEILLKLQSIILKEEIYCEFLKTFERMVFVPLAIENIGSISDSDITVLIKTECEVISPSRTLIAPDIDGLQGVIQGYGFVKDTLGIDDIDIIKHEPDREIIMPRMKPINLSPFSRDEPFDEIDYERELQSRVATPTIIGSTYTTEFVFENLRAKEMLWSRKMLVLRPEEYPVSINYFIRSQKSDGTITGAIRIECT